MSNNRRRYEAWIEAGKIPKQNSSWDETMVWRDLCATVRLQDRQILAVRSYAKRVRRKSFSLGMAVGGLIVLLSFVAWRVVL